MFRRLHQRLPNYFIRIREKIKSLALSKSLLTRVIFILIEIRVQILFCFLNKNCKKLFVCDYNSWVRYFPKNSRKVVKFFVHNNSTSTDTVCKSNVLYCHSNKRPNNPTVFGWTLQMYFLFFATVPCYDIPFGRGDI